MAEYWSRAKAVTMSRTRLIVSQTAAASRMRSITEETFARRTATLNPPLPLVGREALVFVKENVVPSLAPLSHVEPRKKDR